MVHLLCALLGALASLITVIQFTRTPPSSQKPSDIDLPLETAIPAPEAAPLLPSPSPEPAAELSQIVYRTPSGKRYHRATCGHMKGKGIALSLAEAKDQGLTPCKVCNPPPLP